MKPIKTFVYENGLRAVVSAEKAISKKTGGKFPKIYTPGQINYSTVGTDVKIIKETEDSTYIAKFDKNGNISNDDFKILASTDFHFEDDIELRRKTIQFFTNHIMEEKPDLVILTGDIIESRFQQFDAVRFAGFMEKLGVYWAFVFGNHEAREEKEFHKYFLLKNLAQYEHCLTKYGPSDLFGYGNFFINIMGANNTLKQSLVFFDSGRDITDKYRFENGIPSNVGSYDYIKINQMKWYKKNITALQKEYGNVKSLMFMHIPIKEYENVNRLDEKGNYVPTGKCKIYYGSQYESVGSSVINSGLFKLIKELGSTQAVFSGHDHINDFCAEYDGVMLVYIQCGGYETYTMGDKAGWDEKDWMQGVTVVTVKEDSSVKIEQRFNKDYIR